MKRFNRKMLLMLMTMMLVVFGACSVSAATKNVTLKTVKSIAYKPSYIKKNAKKLTAGNYRVRVNYKNDDVNGGYIAFKAPKTKKYQITYSNLLPVNLEDGGMANGYVAFYIDKGDKTAMDALRFSTKGGKADTLWLCSAESYPYLKEKKVTTESCLTDRTATMKLKKGQTMYMYLSFLCSYGSDHNDACIDLKIK